MFEKKDLKMIHGEQNTLKFLRANEFYNSIQRRLSLEGEAVPSKLKSIILDLIMDKIEVLSVEHTEDLARSELFASDLKRHFIENLNEKLAIKLRDLNEEFAKVDILNTENRTELKTRKYVMLFRP